MPSRTIQRLSSSVNEIPGWQRAGFSSQGRVTTHSSRDPAMQRAEEPLSDCSPGMSLSGHSEHTPSRPASRCGSILTRCGWRPSSWKVSGVNTVSCTCFTTGLQSMNKPGISPSVDAETGTRRTSPSPGAPRASTHLGSSGSSGLFLNSDDVLMHGFSSCFPSPGGTEYFLGESTFWARPLQVRSASPTVVFLRLAGGAALDAGCLLLAAFARCVPRRKGNKRCS